MRSFAPAGKALAYIILLPLVAAATLIFVVYAIVQSFPERDFAFVYPQRVLVLLMYVELDDDGDAET